MDIITYLVTDISDLPWIVKGPGLILVVLLLLRAFTQVFTLRWVKAATSVVYALVIALVMARFGLQIAEYIGAEQPQTIEQNQQN